MASPRDTSPKARAEQIRLLRRAGPSARLAMAAELSEGVRDLALASIRRRHPDYDATQVAEVLIDHLHGRSKQRRVPTTNK